MRKSHHGTYRGAIIKIHLFNGTVFYDRFIEATDRYLKLEKEGRISKSNVRLFEPFVHGGLQELGIKRERVEIKPIEKPTVPAYVPPPTTPMEPVVRLETQRIVAFSNLLPSGQTLLSIVVPNAVELIRIKHLLGLEKIEQEKVETTRRISMGDRQYSVKFSRICDYCGESYSVKVDKKTKLGKRCCRKPECMTKYVKDWREWKKSTVSSSVG